MVETMEVTNFTYFELLNISLRYPSSQKNCSTSYLGKKKYLKTIYFSMILLNSQLYTDLYGSFKAVQRNVNLFK